MLALRRRLLACAVLLSAVACSTPSDLPIDASADLPTLLPELVVGQSTREQALLRLGLPMERFEGDRILVWRIAATGGGSSVIVSQFVSPWYGSIGQEDFTAVRVDPRVRIEAYRVRTLVLVFDEAGVLRRSKLLRQS